MLVRKIGAPGNPEFAIGSVAESGEIAMNPAGGDVEIEPGYIDREARSQLRTLQARREQYGAVRTPVASSGRIVVVVDDGVATGATMLAALNVVRRSRPKWLVAAMAVAPADVVERIAEIADDVVCLDTPEDFRAVGQFFDDFTTVTDEQVVATLHEFRRHRAAARTALTADAAPAQRRISVEIPAGRVWLEGELVIPEPARGLVVFAHGSGSSRRSPRNAFVAERLHARGLATLLIDLLTEEEELVQRNRFDIDLLTERLVAATRWAEERHETARLAIGYFGASTGAACALRAAAEIGSRVDAVVSRGGRPDLAMPVLSHVRAPTLLLVGGADRGVIELNREAYEHLRCEKRIEIVPGATHLFEEPGALETVADLAAGWFEAHLAHGAAASGAAVG